MELIPLEYSRIDKLNFFGKTIFIKRDDLLDPIIGGNKARKFYTLINSSKDKLKKLTSFGGVQSNAMLALSFICYKKGWTFEYYVKKIPQLLFKNPTGNYELSLKYGTIFYELGYDNFYQKIEQIRVSLKEKELFIPQGGACELAEEGLKILAYELNNFIKYYDLKNPVIVCSSGTGTTVFYLCKHLLDNAIIVTVPSVGNGFLLHEQFKRLGKIKKEPIILNSSKKFHFGKPYKEFLDLYLELKRLGFEFDLLYDIRTLLSLKEHLNYFLNNELIFIHSGSTIANVSMLERYKYLKMIT